jgi:MinD-like ATPase involved in chromosome partitioning or flagellar assembly
VVLVASGKGGVGTSVAASLLSIACTAAGVRVLLIDGNEGNGSLHHLFGVRPERSLDSLYDMTVDVDDVLIPLDERLSIVASRPASAEQLAIPPERRKLPFARLFASHHAHECVVIDAGARLDNIMAATLAGATTALVVTDADRISLAANYAVIKVLSQRAETVPCHVLVNRHDELVSHAAGVRLSDACRQFLGFDLSQAGWIPDDPCLRAAVGAGMSIGDAVDGSPAAQAMQTVMKRLIPSFAQDPTPRKTGLSNSHPWK